MKQTVSEPTLNEFGDETHPAFAVIGVSRRSSSPGAVLFDSDIQHHRTVVVTLSTATRKRDLSRDWVHEGQQIVEIEMSEAQWASFVSSMNSPGVPCTIRQLLDDHNVDGLPYAPRLAESMREVKSAADEAFGEIRRAMDVVESLDPKAGAKERRDALRMLRAVIDNATPNVEYAGRQLVEHAENVVQRSRADIEAMVASRAAQLGLTAGQAQGLAALPGETD